jgi:hypothetical protein
MAEPVVILTLAGAARARTRAGQLPGSNGADDIMSCNEKSKRLYVAGKAFVSRHFVATLVVIVILLQAIIWLAVRALEDNQNIYRCGDRDYPCGVNIQPEPKI